jgi:hypothetical protein
MAEEKQARRKSKKSFLVVSAPDASGKMVKYYAGPDRKKTRAAAEKLLTENEVEAVTVLTVSSGVTLKKDHLRSMLPKDSF